VPTGALGCLSPMDGDLLLVVQSGVAEIGRVIVCYKLMWGRKGRCMDVWMDVWMNGTTEG
jgi:hypothetical protein